MKSKYDIGLSIVLLMICAFHVVTGGGLVFYDGFVAIAASMYGVGSEWVPSPQFLYITKPLGALMLALGVFAGVAAFKPAAHRITIYVFAGIFIARAVQRLVYSSQITEVFEIGRSRNLINIGFFILLAIVLIVLDISARAVSGKQTSGA